MQPLLIHTYDAASVNLGLGTLTLSFSLSLVLVIVTEKEKAEKLKQSLPPGLTVKEIKPKVKTT